MGKVTLLQPPMLDELKSILQKDAPKSIHMLALIHNMISGKLKGAEIYTNGWPEFSAVVCRSDDVLFHQCLYCYTFKAEDVVKLLHEARLLSSEQRWMILVEDDILDTLLRSLSYQEDVTSHDYVYTYYLPPSTQLKASPMYPDGIILKQLEEQHSDIVASTWPHSDNLLAKHSYFKTLIENYHSVGLFSRERPDEPIGWCVQYPYGQPCHLFITEEYRRRGFASLLLEHMCRCIRADGLTPQVNVDDYNEGSMKLMQRFGFVEHAKFRYVRHLC